MPVFTFRMPAGIPGQVTREQQSTVEAQLMSVATPLTAFGLPGAIDATTFQFRGITTGDAATAVYGFLVRPYPTTGGAVNDPLATATPAIAGICNVLVRGYLDVVVNGATAAVKNGLVYVRVAAAAAGKPIGGIEAAADGGNTIVLPAHTYFMGPADANGNTEIAVNI